MFRINNNDFKIFQKYKSFLMNLDNLLENIPRKDIYFKDTIKNISLDVLKDILLCSYDTSSVKMYRTSIKSNIALLDIYETEVKKNVRNKKKILDFEKHKMEYLVDIKNVLENNLCDCGKYNIFLVFEPKVRVIMALGIYDKIINHYVTRYILIPKLEKEWEQVML